MSINKSIVEDTVLTWFGELSYAVGHGRQIASGEPAVERDSFGEVVLVRCYRPSWSNRARRGNFNGTGKHIRPKMAEAARCGAASKALFTHGE